MENKLNLSDMEKVELWKQRFFEAQAGFEKYLVDKYGYEDIDEWIKFNARVFKNLQEDSGGASDLVLRFAKQAECYQSDYNIDNLDKDFAVLTISHCGIWDYREKARQRGVELTFDSPCTRYCTKLTSQMILSKGYSVSYQLIEDSSQHGCRWIISSSGTNSKNLRSIQNEQ